jgi:ribosomal protein S18 acetylase RimI-like enzyme
MNIINIKFTDINKFNKQQKDELEDLLNIEHKHFANFYNKNNLIKKIDLDEYIKSNRDVNDLYFLLYYKEKKLVGRIEYHEHTVNNKIIRNRFIYKNGTYLWIKNVFVLEEYRRQGILHNIFDYLFKNISNKNVALSVDKSNINALKAYEKFGLKKIIERKVTNKLVGSNDYTEYFVEYLMIKE